MTTVYLCSLFSSEDVNIQEYSSVPVDIVHQMFSGIYGSFKLSLEHVFTDFTVNCIKQNCKLVM
jgi:hypothetical protein